jgi:hypothetical protein
LALSEQNLPPDDAFATGIDARSDELTPAEAEAMRHWYESAHGSGNLDLVRYVPFMLAENPAALKRFRHWADVVAGGRGLRTPLPAPLMALVWLHFYCVNPFPSGLLYEVIAARRWGAGKREVIDTITLAWIHGGPHGIEVAATSSADYLAGWQDEGGGLTWPEGWDRDPTAFRSGISFDDENSISGDDLRRLEEWHRENQGEVPGYVPFLARRYPLALKVFRARYEAACSGSLARQFVPILQLPVAMERRDVESVRRLTFQARKYGASDDQILNAAGTAQVYLGDLGMAVGLEGVAQALDG